MRNLPHDLSDPSVVNALNGMRDFELLTTFFNWLDRYIHPHARAVLKSTTYVFRWTPPKHQVNLERLDRLVTSTGGKILIYC